MPPPPGPQYWEVKKRNGWYPVIRSAGLNIQSVMAPLIELLVKSTAAAEAVTSIDEELPSNKFIVFANVLFLSGLQSPKLRVLKAPGSM